MKLKVLSAILVVCVCLVASLRIPEYQEQRDQQSLTARLSQELEIITRKNQLDPQFAKIRASSLKPENARTHTDDTGSESKILLPDV